MVDASEGDGGQGQVERLIFVVDASAEAERLISALRGRSYPTVDVPLGLLVSRVSAQKPNLIVCDVDAPGAFDAIQSLHEVPGTNQIDVLFLGHPGGVLDQMRDRVAHEASGVFVRPVEPYALLRKVEALIGTPTGQPGEIPMPSGRPPVLVAATRRPFLYDGSQSSAQISEAITSSPAAHAPTASASTDPPWESSVAAEAAPSRAAVASRPSPLPEPDFGLDDPLSPERSWKAAPSVRSADLSLSGEQGDPTWLEQVPQAEMSPQLRKILNQAELRLSLTPISASPALARLSPEAEVDLVLPADVLAALDEPLTVEEERDVDTQGRPLQRAKDGTDTGAARDRTSASTNPGTPGPRRTRSGTGSAVRDDLTRADPQAARPTPRPPRARPNDEAPQMPREGTSLGVPPLPNPSIGPVGSLRPSIRTSIGATPVPPPFPTTPPPNRGSMPSALPAETPSAAPIATVAKERPEADPRATSPEQLVPDVTHAGYARAERGASEVPSGPESPRSGAGDPAPPTAPHRGVRTDPPVSDGASNTGPATIAQKPKPYLQPERAGSTVGQAPPIIAASVRSGDTIAALARVIRARYSGALAIETPQGVRRVVLRDGDFVIVGSGIEGDSLVQFLTERGDLSADVGTALGRRLPPFGRHAGAALIAQGHLRQDELWSALRSHAEWLLAKIVLTEEGAASLEAVPDRLSAEPAVFGGATGAEVLVEIVRRSVSPEVALGRLGDPARALLPGPAPELLAECALPEQELGWISGATTAPLGELVERAASPDLVTVLYVLRELSVLATPRVEDQPEIRIPKPIVADRIDEAAVRARIKTRRALVDDGDYFAVLGLPRSATTYDVRRAYLELRRSFDPSQVLTPGTADLRDDVDTILEVLDEAYDVLRDQIRLQRYRRALEANP